MQSNLLDIPWIQVVHRSGRRGVITPAQIVACREDPVIDLAFNRPDFNGTAIQFLIGLLQTACPPESEGAWIRRYRKPPSVDELRSAFSPYAKAFAIEGYGALFMQDFDPGLKDEPIAINRLLLSEPNEGYEGRNTDHFTHRSGSWRLCAACASLTLFTLQLNAPEGGRGHYTSLRGGGPMTTIGLGETLWHTVWGNVLPVAELGGASLALCDDSVFPWMGPTKCADTHPPVTPENVSPLMAYWAMPRRVRFASPVVSQGERCTLCHAQSDAESPHLYTHFMRRPNGAIYTSPPWRHFLSPHYATKEGAMLPRHPSRNFGGYRVWDGVVASKVEGGIARVIHRLKVAQHLTLDEAASIRIWLFGYETDGIEAVQWHDARMPFLKIEEQYLTEYDDCILDLIRATDYIAMQLYSCVKQGLFTENTEVRGDLSFTKSALWDRSEDRFYATLTTVRENLRSGCFKRGSTLELWIEHLQRLAGDVYEEHVMSQDLTGLDPARVFSAQRRLRLSTGKWSPKLRKELSLPQVEEATTPATGKMRALKKMKAAEVLG